MAHKFGHPFTFRFDGLFVWTMNQVMTVDEGSVPSYLARIRPYRFNVSFLDREDPAIEERIRERELPGVLVLLVHALQRVEAHGGYIVDDATEREAGWFRRETDRIAMFLNECTATGSWTPRIPLYRAYDRWCQENRRGSPLNRRGF